MKVQASLRGPKPLKPLKPLHPEPLNPKPLNPETLRGLDIEIALRV